MSRRNGTWRRERDHDAFFHEARRRGLRSRAALKLEAIDARDRLLRGTRVVVDLGAAPGGWSQIARQSLAPGGRVVSIDVLEMEPLDGVEFIRGDFLLPEVLSRIEASVGRRTADLVMSDMAPNLTGMRVHDQARWRELAESAAGFAIRVLKPGGTFLVKLFQGEETEPYLRMLRERYANVAVRKPAGRACGRRNPTPWHADPGSGAREQTQPPRTPSTPPGRPSESEVTALPPRRLDSGDRAKAGHPSGGEANGRRTGSCGIVSAGSTVVDVGRSRGENRDWNNLGIQ